MLTDVHAHICDPVFDNDRADVLKRAREAGVSSVIAVGETLADAHKNLALSDIHPEILPAAGLYPTVLDLDEASAVELFIRENRQRLIAIGEVGLDYWKVQNETDREIQREIFKRFIELRFFFLDHSGFSQHPAMGDTPFNIPSVKTPIRFNGRREHFHALIGLFAKTAFP